MTAPAKEATAEGGRALAAQAAPTPLAGSWKQSSSKQELTLRPQMKIKPAIAPGYVLNPIHEFLREAARRALSLPA